MVTSEEETPALRIQALLDPDYLHQVSIRAAERIFAPVLGDLETFPTGRIVRRDGRILGSARSEDEILASLSKLVLVGGSVGCVVSLQVARWLDVLLQELGFSESLREEAQRSFLVVNLGPTTPQRGGPTNLLSVVNLRDEFVFAGNHTAPYERRIAAGGPQLMPEQEEGDSSLQSDWTVALEVAGTLTPGEEGLSFDPLGTHFGHSLKHYANGLRPLGVSHLLRRALELDGSFRLGALVSAAREAGELQA